MKRPATGSMWLDTRKVRPPKKIKDLAGWDSALRHVVQFVDPGGSGCHLVGVISIWQQLRADGSWRVVSERASSVDLMSFGRRYLPLPDRDQR